VWHAELHRPAEHLQRTRHVAGDGLLRDREARHVGAAAVVAPDRRHGDVTGRVGHQLRRSGSQFPQVRAY
jgi:hypothetical protein